MEYPYSQRVWEQVPMFAVDQPFTDECYERNLPNNSLFWESYEDPLYQEELLLNPMSPNNIAILMSLTICHMEVAMRDLRFLFPCLNLLL